MQINISQPDWYVMHSLIFQYSIEIASSALSFTFHYCKLLWKVTSKRLFGCKFFQEIEKLHTIICNRLHAKTLTHSTPCQTYYRIQNFVMKNFLPFFVITFWTHVITTDFFFPCFWILNSVNFTLSVCCLSWYAIFHRNATLWLLNFLFGFRSLLNFTFLTTVLFIFCDYWARHS